MIDQIWSMKMETSWADFCEFFAAVLGIAAVLLMISGKAKYKNVLLLFSASSALGILSVYLGNPDVQALSKKIEGIQAVASDFDDTNQPCSPTRQRDDSSRMKFNTQIDDLNKVCLSDMRAEPLKYAIKVFLAQITPAAISSIVYFEDLIKPKPERKGGCIELAAEMDKMCGNIITKSIPRRYLTDVNK